MKPLSKKKYISSEEYLEFERAAADKYEYFDGEIFAMAGSSYEHAIITSHINTSLSVQIKNRKCESTSADLRVHVPATGLYTYPDIVVVCGEPRFLSDAYLDTLLNPILIIESSHSQPRIMTGAQNSIIIERLIL